MTRKAQAEGVWEAEGGGGGLPQLSSVGELLVRVVCPSGEEVSRKGGCKQPFMDLGGRGGRAHREAKGVCRIFLRLSSSSLCACV